MFDNSIVDILKTVVSWKDFWNAAEIPALGAPYTDTPLSGQYYQGFNELVRLDYITSLLDERPLTTFLADVETDGITQVLNRIVTEKQLGRFGKTIATNNVVYNVGRKTATMTNESRFCGVMFEVSQETGIRAIINRIGLYLTAAVTDLDIYVYHSSKTTPVTIFQYSSTATYSFGWEEHRQILDFDNGVISGGTWYIGYYQDDLALQSSQAVQYSAMNWLNGYCNQCGATAKANDVKYKSIRNRLVMKGFYVPSASLPAKGTMFNPSIVIQTNTNNWGFNFNITIGCDLTQFWKDNRRNFANVIGLAVAMKVLEMMKSSTQLNNIEESVKIMIIRDLEGTTDTDNPPLNQKLSKAIEALNLDMGNVRGDCLPSAKLPKTKYGAAG